LVELGGQRGVERNGETVHGYLPELQ
jgi:hypothetical protein